MAWNIVLKFYNSAGAGHTIEKNVIGWVKFSFDQMWPLGLEDLTANAVGAAACLPLPATLRETRSNARYPWKVDPISGGDQWEDKPTEAPFVNWIKEHCISASDAEVVFLKVNLLPGNDYPAVCRRLRERGYVIDYRSRPEYIVAKNLAKEIQADIFCGRFNAEIFEV